VGKGIGCEKLVPVAVIGRPRYEELEHGESAAATDAQLAAVEDLQAVVDPDPFGHLFGHDVVAVRADSIGGGTEPTEDSVLEIADDPGRLGVEVMRENELHIADLLVLDRFSS
jgi:hypothetical protein